MDTPFAATMVEGIRYLIAVCLLLDIVVADLRGGVDGVLNVARFDGSEHLIVHMAPDSGEIVGLEFKANAYLVGFFLRKTRHGGMGLLKSAEKVLYVVAYLMGDHIGVAEIAGSAYLALHRLEEVKVDVDGLVG